MSEEEVDYNYIIENKPSNKIVREFLKTQIDAICAAEDEQFRVEDEEDIFDDKNPIQKKKTNGSSSRSTRTSRKGDSNRNR